mmetsp:Transcript_6539/g.17766  ORF Transcript_6539/g.17766 Transcript_6539/m.17766 type:complete len:227 (-) Transcript_6539:165-845(-)
MNEVSWRRYRSNAIILIRKTVCWSYRVYCVGVDHHRGAEGNCRVVYKYSELFYYICNIFHFIYFCIADMASHYVLFYYFIEHVALSSVSRSRKRGGCCPDRHATPSSSQDLRQRHSQCRGNPSIALHLRRAYAKKYSTIMGTMRNAMHKMGKAPVPSVVRYHQTSSQMYCHVHRCCGALSSCWICCAALPSFCVASPMYCSTSACISSRCCGNVALCWSMVKMSRV